MLRKGNGMKPKTYCEKWPVGCQFCDLLLCDGKKETAEKRCYPCKPTQPECGECEFAKPQTNYDLIISKTPEELADSFASRCCPVKYEYYNCGEINKKEFSWEDCKSCWLDWLKAPVEEVDNG